MFLSFCHKCIFQRAVEKQPPQLLKVGTLLALSPHLLKSVVETKASGFMSQNPNVSPRHDWWRRSWQRPGVVTKPCWWETLLSLSIIVSSISVLDVFHQLHLESEQPWMSVLYLLCLFEESLLFAFTLLAIWQCNVPPFTSWRSSLELRVFWTLSNITGGELRCKFEHFSKERMTVAVLLTPLHFYLLLLFLLCGVCFFFFLLY